MFPRRWGERSWEHGLSGGQERDRIRGGPRFACRELGQTLPTGSGGTCPRSGGCRPVSLSIGIARSVPKRIIVWLYFLSCCNPMRCVILGVVAEASAIGFIVPTLTIGNVESSVSRWQRRRFYLQGSSGRAKKPAPRRISGQAVEAVKFSRPICSRSNLARRRAG